MPSFSFVESLESRRLLAAGYQIQLVFESSVSAAVKTVIQNAANRWQQVITGDVADVGAGAWGAAVDDIRITARVKSIDGAGKGLAQARPTFLRSNHLPLAGEIEIDSADVSSSALASTVTHEIAHALGFGLIWSQYSGLTSGTGGSNPLFLGSNALREYRAYAGNNSLAGVPLENTSVSGTRDVHWRESTFSTELMTGFLGAGSNPLSRITIGQFADLGYTVNYGAADGYTLPGVTPPSNSAKISGKVFTDKDNDKTFDTGEPGVTNRAVYLDTNNNSARDSGETQVTTDASGNYTFSNLPAGTYKVRIARDGLTQTFPANNFGIGVTLSSGQSVSNQNFATIGGSSTPTNTAKISGKVFTDKDGDKTFDTGETGVTNRTVYIDLDNDSALDSNETRVVTDSSGNYTFSNLAAGTYKVRIVRDGLTQTFPANNFGIGVTLSSGQSVSNQNFATIASTARFASAFALVRFGEKVIDRNREIDALIDGL